MGNDVLIELQAKRDALLQDAQAIERTMQILTNGGNGGTAIAAAPAAAAVSMGGGSTVTLQDATITPKKRGRPAKAKTTVIKVAPKEKKTPAPRDPATAHKGGRRPAVSAEEMKARVLQFVNSGAPETDANGYSVEAIQKGLDTNRPAANTAIQALREEGALIETTGKGKGWRFRASGTASTAPAVEEEAAPEAPAEVPVEVPAEVFTDPYMGDEEDAPVEVDDDAEVEPVEEEPATVNFGS